jgi:hypothetical protein
MNLKTFTLTLASNRLIEGTSAQLRGFFATKFNEYTLLTSTVPINSFTAILWCNTK